MAFIRILDDNNKFVARINGVSYVEGTQGDIYIEKENGAYFRMSDVKIEQFNIVEED